MLINQVYTQNNQNTFSYSTADVFRPNAFIISFEEFKSGSKLFEQLNTFINEYLKICNIIDTDTNKPFTEINNDFITSKSDSNSITFHQNLLPLLAKSVVLPDMNIEVSAIELGLWKTQRIVNRKTFDTFNITFQELRGLPVRFYFLKWMFAYIINPWKGYHVQPDLYKSKITVQVLKNIDDYKPLYTVTFYGQFPTNLNELTLSYENSDILNTEVTFAYDYFDIDITTQTQQTGEQAGKGLVARGGTIQ